MLKKGIVTHGDRLDDLPTREDCTVLGACKEEQDRRVATIDDFLQRVVWMTCLLPHLKAFPFSLLGGQPKRIEKERNIKPMTKISKQIEHRRGLMPSRSMVLYYMVATTCRGGNNKRKWHINDT